MNTIKVSSGQSICGRRYMFKVTYTDGTVSYSMSHGANKKEARERVMTRLAQPTEPSGWPQT